MDYDSKFKELLEQCLGDEANDLDYWHSWGDTVCLDGDFSSKQLRAFADALDKFSKEV